MRLSKHANAGRAQDVVPKYHAAIIAVLGIHKRRRAQEFVIGAKVSSERLTDAEAVAILMGGAKVQIANGPAITSSSQPAHMPQGASEVGDEAVKTHHAK